MTFVTVGWKAFLKELDNGLYEANPISEPGYHKQYGAFLICVDDEDAIGATRSALYANLSAIVNDPIKFGPLSEVGTAAIYTQQGRPFGTYFEKPSSARLKTEKLVSLGEGEHLSPLGIGFEEEVSGVLEPLGMLPPGTYHDV